MAKVKKLEDTDPMPFGKYKGTPMADVPGSYLLWLHNKADIFDGRVAAYIKENLEIIKKEK